MKRVLLFLIDSRAGVVAECRVRRCSRNPAPLDIVMARKARRRALRDSRAADSIKPISPIP